MAAWHADLGLGRFPSSPVVDYLTRSLSALYALHGGLLFVLAADPRRHRPLIGWVGWSNLALGCGLLATGLSAGLPGWWVALEGPWVVGVGIAVLVLRPEIA